MLTCLQVTELVTAYVEGELGLRDRLAMALHLSMCAHCRRYVRQVRAVVKAMPSVPVPPPPDDVVASLSSAFKKSSAPDRDP